MSKEEPVVSPGGIPLLKLQVIAWLLGGTVLINGYRYRQHLRRRQSLTPSPKVLRRRSWKEKAVM
jgi:hypothetical protein